MSLDPENTHQPLGQTSRNAAVDDGSLTTVHPSHAPSVLNSHVDVAPMEKERPSAFSIRDEQPTVEKEMNAVEKKADEVEEEDESKYPHGPKLWLISLALSMSVFLVALVSFSTTNFALFMPRWMRS